MRNKVQTMVSVGDLLIQCECDVNPLFDDVREEITSADISVGQCESVFTDRGDPTYVDLFCTQIVGSWPEHVDAIRNAGFDVMTLCSNHVWDLGKYGVMDTIDACKRNNLLYTGAGMNIDEALTACNKRSGWGEVRLSCL